MPIIDYDEKFDTLRIIFDDSVHSYGENFLGGVVYKSIETDQVTGVLLWNTSKIMEAREKLTNTEKNVPEKMTFQTFRQKKQNVTIWTDGACVGNPGPGGWAAIVRGDTFAEQEIYGGEEFTTNNRMELMAAINALALLEAPCIVTIYSDSQYVVNGIEKGWAASWKKNGWKKSDGKSALNQELWDELLSLCEKHEVTFKWVRGHNGNPENERCDKLAVTEAQKAERKGI